MFIVFEGIDGSGKTTISKAVYSNLIKYNNKIILTKEPYNITDELKNTTDNDKLLELFIQDREYHIDNLIKPKLQENYIILCDRYYYTTMAYQNITDYSKIKTNNIIEPDLIFYIDCPPKIAYSRIQNTRDDLDKRFETLERLIEVYNNYDQIMIGPRIIKIDNSSLLEESIYECIKLIKFLKIIRGKKG